MMMVMRCTPTQRNRAMAMKIDRLMRAIKRIPKLTLETKIVEGFEPWSGEKYSFYRWTAVCGNRFVRIDQLRADIDNCCASSMDYSPTWESSTAGAVSFKKIKDVANYLAGGAS